MANLEEDKITSSITDLCLTTLSEVPSAKREGNEGGRIFLDLATSGNSLFQCLSKATKLLNRFIIVRDPELGQVTSNAYTRKPFSFVPPSCEGDREMYVRLNCTSKASRSMLWAWLGEGRG